MNRFSIFFRKTTNNIKTTIVRFPIVILILAFVSIIISILIEDSLDLREQLLTRFIFSGIFGAFLGIASQFLIERFKKVSNYKLILNTLTIILSIFYFYFLTSDDRFSQAVVVRLFVCIFALFSTYLFIPSIYNDVDFGKISLVHFKSAFTSILYGFVIYIGLISIYFAIDLLLFKLDNNIIGHMANIVFVFFAPIYYLSLLPVFNSNEKDDVEKNYEKSIYPRVLEILVSYIVIPLITIFSVVLIIYFIKILFTGIWPVGQVGPMVLGYSAVGLFVYILGFNLVNKFTLMFRKLFPYILMPLVIMQFVSSYIRIEAYGITESRYYVIIFGVFSVVCSLYLILSKKKNPNMIVILAACFAVVSIIPPVDAFSISSNSQETRINNILVKNKMLIDNKLVSNESISNQDKYEITSITNYMARMGYLRNLEWLPEKYYEENMYYSEFEKIFGFAQYYDNYYSDENNNYIYAVLDTNFPINVVGFDAFLKINIYNNASSSNEQITKFNLNNNSYSIAQNNDDAGNFKLYILNDNGEPVIEIPMKDFLDTILENSGEAKALMPPENLTLNAFNDKIKVRLIFDNINIENLSNGNVSINGSSYVFIGTP
jgi:hypothetical protein